MKEYSFSNNWFDATAAHYWDRLKKHLLKTFQTNLNCLDIGTYEGRSAIWMVENLIKDSGSLHIVDPLRDDYKSTLLRNISKTGIEERIFLHEGDSIIELPKILEEKSEYFSFIYIDAGKTASDNCLNALLAERMLKVGGILVIDDYLWGKPGIDFRYAPRLGIDSYASLTLLTELQNTPRTQAVFIKHSSNGTLLVANK